MTNINCAYNSEINNYHDTYPLLKDALKNQEQAQMFFDNLPGSVNEKLFSIAVERLNAANSYLNSILGIIKEDCLTSQLN